MDLDLRSSDKSSDSLDPNNLGNNLQKGEENRAKIAL